MARQDTRAPLELRGETRVEQYEARDPATGLIVEVTHDIDNDVLSYAWTERTTLASESTTP